MHDGSPSDDRATMTTPDHPRPPPKVAILGAGAVGGFFGAKLARAGVDVTLIGRAIHVKAIARDGLTILTADGDWQVPVRATTDVAAVRDADIVLVTVKTPDTAAATRALAPHLRAGARVVSMQNGVDNATRIAAGIPHAVLAAVVYVGAFIDGPGRIRHTGRGDLVLGVPHALAARGNAAANLRAIRAMFERADVRCPTTPDIEAALWTKLTINAAFNAISALANTTYGHMAASAPVRAVMEDAVREVVAVARADHVALDADGLIAAAWKLAAAMAQQYSSTAQDMQRGKPTEIDALNGYVAQRGVQLGVPTPVNRTLHALVKLREEHVG
jgi:2-dehydropantoate 2-reductase